MTDSHSYPGSTEAGEVCDGCGKLLICRHCGKFRSASVAQSSRVRLATIEECARIAEAQAQEFLSPEYASNQPLGSFCERFACDEVAKSIRALASQPSPAATVTDGSIREGDVLSYTMTDGVGKVTAHVRPHNGSSAASDLDDLCKRLDTQSRGWGTDVQKRRAAKEALDAIKRLSEPQQVSEPGSMRAQWTFDAEARAYYFAPLQASPPPYTTREVTAILDIANDGTLAGVEICEMRSTLPEPPLTSPLPRPQSRTGEA